MKKKDTHLVSVIVPIYNAEKYLVQCVDSILKQTYDYLEIMLIDDGSTDQSGIICDRYADEARVKVFHNTNHGLSYSRQFGIDHCNGDYFITVDADDYLDQLFVQKMYELVTSNSCDIAKCARYDFSDDRPNNLVRKDCCEIKYQICVNDLENRFVEIAKVLNLSDSWDKIYRTSFVRKSGVRFDLKKGYNGNDYAFNHKLVLSCPKSITCNEPLLYHRITPASMIRKINDSMQDGFEEIIRQIYTESKIKGVNIRKHIGVLYFRLMYNYVLNIFYYSKDKNDRKSRINKMFSKHLRFVAEENIELPVRLQANNFVEKVFFYSLNNRKVVLLEIFAELFVRLKTIKDSISERSGIEYGTKS